MSTLGKYINMSSVFPILLRGVTFQVATFPLLLDAFEISYNVVLPVMDSFSLHDSGKVYFTSALKKPLFSFFFFFETVENL